MTEVNVRPRLILEDVFDGAMYGFYSLHNNSEVWMTREQIGHALRYKYGRKAIRDIHKRHFDRVDGHAIMVPIDKGTGGEHQTVLYDQSGISEICRFSRKKSADHFMNFVQKCVNYIMQDDRNKEEF